MNRKKTYFRCETNIAIHLFRQNKARFTPIWTRISFPFSNDNKDSVTIIQHTYIALNILTVRNNHDLRPNSNHVYTLQFVMQLIGHIALPQENGHISTKVNFKGEAKEDSLVITVTWHYSTQFLFTVSWNYST